MHDLIETFTKRLDTLHIGIVLTTEREREKKIKVYAHMSPNFKVLNTSKQTDMKMSEKNSLPQVDLMFVMKFSATRVSTTGKHRKPRTSSGIAVTVVGFDKWMQTQEKARLRIEC